MKYKIGDVVKDVKWGECEILTNGNIINGGDFAYIGKPLESDKIKYDILCLLEKDLIPIK